MGHLQALAHQPRPAGSEAAAEARTYCAAHLRSLGFTVTERPFSYSALPGRFGAPIVGGIASILLAFTASIGVRGHPVNTAAAMAVVLATAAVLGAWLGGPLGTQSRFLLRNGVNLEATMGEQPSLWLVAHLDSKSQPVSTAVRTFGVIVLGAAMTDAAIGAGLGLVGVELRNFWIPVGILAVVGGIPLICSVVGVISHGAADNASGVAAVLEAAEHVAPGKSFGVLITDAEELALAGARAWVRGRPKGIAINADTIDDAGQTLVMRYGPASGRVVSRAGAMLIEQGGPSRVIRPFPGVLTDSVAFRDAGWETVTLCRGSLRTLNRIHTVRDNLQSIRGDGIPVVARVLARLVEEFV